MSAAERASEASSAEQASEGAGKRANGGANGPVLYASISKLSYPMCSAVVMVAYPAVLVAM